MYAIYTKFVSLFFWQVCCVHLRTTSPEHMYMCVMESFFSSFRFVFPFNKIGIGKIEQLYIEFPVHAQIAIVPFSIYIPHTTVQLDNTFSFIEVYHYLHWKTHKRNFTAITHLKRHWSLFKTRQWISSM